MSISRIQYERKKQEFIEELVKKGIEPNNFELHRLLSEYFDNHTMGMPYYTPIKQVPYEESSKEHYNHNFQTFQEDIETVYQADIEANNKAVAMQEYYDLEKTKVQNALAKLALRIKNVTEALKMTSRTKQFVEVFDDLYDVEFCGDTSRNIPYTSSFVDLLQKRVYTNKSHAQVNKIPVTNATISLDGFAVFSSWTSQGSLEKILNDTLDEIYVLSCRSKTCMEQYIDINVDLGSLKTFNTVLFSYTSTREMQCQLFISEDGENYIAVYDVSSRDFIEWNFSAKTARYIRIRCIKSEADGADLSNPDVCMYEYYFLFKNITIAREAFEEKSVFVSKVIEFDDLTSTIRLDATDLVFANTRIDYFIGFDNGTGKIGWDSIPNHDDYQLFMFEKRSKILNGHVEEFGSMGEVLNLYKLCKLPDGINRNSIKLTPGYNMWSVKEYTRKEGDSNEDEFSINTEDFSEHVASCDMTQLFMDCENYDSFSLKTNVLYVFTQFISLEKATNLFDNYIRIMSDADCSIDDPYAEVRVFLNGVEVTPIDDCKYSFGLRKGVNKIQIAIHCPSDQATTRRLFHNLNFKALTNDVFACVPMKYTSNQILNRMVGETYEYYTIKDNYIYVKVEPSRTPDGVIRHELEDMGYFMSYYCLREDMQYYFENNHLKFRIMAVLHSTDKNMSPSILNYRLTGR